MWRATSVDHSVLFVHVLWVCPHLYGWQCIHLQIDAPLPKEDIYTYIYIGTIEGTTLAKIKLE